MDNPNSELLPPTPAASERMRTDLSDSKSSSSESFNLNLDDEFKLEEIDPKLDPLQKIKILARNLTKEIKHDTLEDTTSIISRNIENADAKLFKKFAEKVEPKKTTEELINIILKLTDTLNSDNSTLEYVMEHAIRAIPPFKVRCLHDNTTRSASTEYYKDEMLELLAQRKNQAPHAISSHPASHTYGEYFKCSTPTP